MSAPYDQAFKLTNDDDPYGTLTIIAGAIVEPGAVIEVVDRELNPECLYADHLYRVRSGGREYLHHTEALTRYNSGWVKQQMDHAVYAGIKYRVAVYSHLLLFQQKGTPKHIEDVIVRESGGLTQSLKVNIIRLWERPAGAVLEAGRPALYPWTALMNASWEEQREAARRIMESGSRGLQMQMAMLGELRYGEQGFLERMGQMLTKDILRETPLWQEIERSGEIRGKAEGLRDGERRALRQFLSARFGPLPEWAENRLEQADLPTLELWLGRAATEASLGSVLE